MISIGFWFEAFTPLPEKKERVANTGDDELKSRLKGAAAGKPLYDLIKGGEAAEGTGPSTLSQRVFQPQVRALQDFLSDSFICYQDQLFK